MTIIDLLTEVNGSYLMALAVLIFLLVEGIKATKWMSASFIPLVAGVVGSVVGIIIGLIYGENLVVTSLNGLIAGLLSAGSFDFMKAMRQLPELFE